MASGPAIRRPACRPRCGSARGWSRLRCQPLRTNGPGRLERQGQRAPGVLRVEPVAPRKLGHAVVGTTDLAITTAFFTDGIGFKLSDKIKDAGAFLRCSVDHHNLLVLAAPVTYLHHTSWQVDDIDDVGRGASAMLEDHPERHVWGLGRPTRAPTSSGISRIRRQLQRVLLRHGLHPRRRAMDTGGPRRRKGLFNWGPPHHRRSRARRLGGAHDRKPRAALKVPRRQS